MRGFTICVIDTSHDFRCVFIVDKPFFFFGLRVFCHAGNLQLGQTLRAWRNLTFPVCPAGALCRCFHSWESAALVLSQALRDSSRLCTSLSANIQGCLRQQSRPQMRADSGRCPHLGSSTPTISPIWLLCLSKHTVPGCVGTDLNHTFCWNFLFRWKTSPWDVEMGIRGPGCPSVFRQHSFTYFIWNDDQRVLWRAPQGPAGLHTSSKHHQLLLVAAEV